VQHNNTDQVVWAKISSTYGFIVSTHDKNQPLNSAAHTPKRGNGALLTPIPPQILNTLLLLHPTVPKAQTLGHTKDMDKFTDKPTMSSTSGSLDQNGSSTSVPPSYLNEAKSHDTSNKLASTNSKNSQTNFSPSFSKPETGLRQRNIRPSDTSNSQDDTISVRLRHKPHRMETPQPKPRPSWLILALSSGTFAALNGAFAKLYCFLFLILYTSQPP
jgi:hypothetical protein